MGDEQHIPSVHTAHPGRGGPQRAAVKAVNTYNLNFKHKADVSDVKDLSFKKATADMVVGGFPCQAFSVAGYQKGFKDPRGNLFFEIMRIVEELPEKPKVLFLENVKNFYSHDKGRTYKIVKQALESHGYSVFTEILNTAEYTEIPHNRERTFIICFRQIEKVIKQCVKKFHTGGLM